MWPSPEAPGGLAAWGAAARAAVDAVEAAVAGAETGAASAAAVAAVTADIAGAAGGADPEARPGAGTAGAAGAERGAAAAEARAMDLPSRQLTRRLCRSEKLQGQPRPVLYR